MGTKQENSTVLERETQKLKPPPMYKVILLNDDYTPMEFVVAIVQEYFNKEHYAKQTALLSHKEIDELALNCWFTDEDLEIFNYQKFAVLLQQKLGGKV